MTQTIRKLWSLFDRSDRRRASGLLVLMLVGAFLEVAAVGLIPGYLALLIHPQRAMRLHPIVTIISWLGINQVSQFLIAAAIFVILVFVCKNVYDGVLQYLEASFAAKLQTKVGDALLGAYLRAPYSWHLRRNSADLIRNTNTTLPQLATYVVNPMLTLVTEALIVVAVFVLLLVVDPITAIVVLGIFGCASLVFYRIVQGRLSRLGQLLLEYTGRMIQIVSEGLGGLKEARVLGGEGHFLRAYNHFNRKAAGIARDQRVVTQLPQQFLEVLGILTLMGVSIVLLAVGQSPQSLIPVLALFGAAAVRVMPSLNRILSALTLIRFYTRAIDEVARDLALPREAGTRGTGRQVHPGAHMIGDVIVEDVSFTYEGAARPALGGISLTIEQGSAVALVGASGAGKTTLADVILGLLPPDRGAVRVAGVDIQADLAAWRGHIGYVPQSIFLLDDTIRRNIAFGVRDVEIDEGQLQAAVAVAQLESHLASLPDGLDTFVGERGVRLSGGQRQRIGIARALYRNPPYLVFDEATSAVDNATEKAIVEAVEGLRGDRTILVIAHRLSTVERCDQLFVLRDGCLEAQGRYWDLIEKSDHFRTIAAHAVHALADQEQVPPDLDIRDAAAST